MTHALAGTLRGRRPSWAAWSRLLIDLNRGPDDPTLVMKLSDGSIIPGNRDALMRPKWRRRIAQFHAPYHAAIHARPEPHR